MVILDDIKIKFKDMAAKFDDCVIACDLEKLKKRKEELDVAQSDPDLYKNLSKAQSVNVEAKYVSDKLKELSDIEKQVDDLREFISLVETENDDKYVAEIESLLEKLEDVVEQLYLSTLLKGEYDRNNAILTLHSGAGGTEAQDWVQMLYRMYKMYADKNGFDIEEIDYLDGDEAGIKSVTFMVKGINAYGYLKAEKGVHRLVRISPFDSNARRHTSFASLEVMPEIEIDTAVKIAPDEINIDTYRAGGAGGQHVNKTDSAVRMTHLPTGIVVQCQNERSQISNRETAMKMLVSRLAELREREQLEKANAIKGTLKKIEWGSQIRSYVFQPYTMVKDHRTNFENTDITSVMNGNIQEFIFEYLRKS